jgi:hypothetical protein
MKNLASKSIIAVGLVALALAQSAAAKTSSTKIDLATKAIENFQIESVLQVRYLRAILTDADIAKLPKDLKSKINTEFTHAYLELWPSILSHKAKQAAANYSDVQLRDIVADSEIQHVQNVILAGAYGTAEPPESEMSPKDLAVFNRVDNLTYVKSFYIESLKADKFENSIIQKAIKNTISNLEQ